MRLVVLLAPFVSSCVPAPDSSGDGCSGVLPDGRDFSFEDGERFCDGTTLLECEGGDLASIPQSPECGAGGDADGDADGDGDGDADGDADPVDATPVGPGTLRGQEVVAGVSRWYRLDLARGTHAMFEVLFPHGSGDVDIKLYDHALGYLHIAESATDDERVSAWSPDADETFYLEVFLWEGDTHPSARFDLRVVEAPLDATTPVCSAGAACAELRQVPAPLTDAQGFSVASERAAFHFMRHDVLQALLYATRELGARYPGTTPLGVLQVGDWLGRIPGVKEGAQWHPDYTHENGFDMDLAYYRTDGENGGGYVCEDSRCEVSVAGGCYDDGAGGSVDYFCDSSSGHRADPEQMAAFLGLLVESRIVRVVGADRIIVPDILAAADGLVAAGSMEPGIRDDIYRKLECPRSYDQCFQMGWAFHVHHIHVSTTR